jgi:hypothetical protein
MAEWRGTKVPLDFPITEGDKTFAFIELREPDADALEAIEDAGFQEGVQPTNRQLKQSIQALSKWPMERVGKLHRKDFARVTEACVPLLQEPSEGSGTDTSGATTSTESAPT